MTELACPSCGAPVRFQSRISVFAVCPYCAQMLVRRDIDVEAIGKMALLPEEQTPLQLGAGGTYEGKKFTLLGRIRQQWTDGNWNEWFAQFDDGRHGWLAEAQGFLMMSFEVPDAAGLPALNSLRAGLKVTVAGKTLEVDDIKEVVCVGSEGELPFRAPQGRKATSVDLAGPGQTFASLDYSPEGIRAYMGKYIELEELKFQGLRQLNGW